MFSGELPGFRGLFLAASVSPAQGQNVSATGVARTLEDAQMRHDAERAERRVADAQPSEGGVVGWAAGRDDMALIERRACFELAERWLAAAWWAGQIAPGALSPKAAARLSQIKDAIVRKADRRDGALVIRARDWPSIVVAWSCDPDGFGLCFGLAGGVSEAEAATSAWIELCQMEFGLALSRHRKDASAATAHDKSVLDRARRLSRADVAELLEPSEASRAIYVPDWPGDLKTEHFHQDDHGVVRAINAGLPPVRTTTWPLYV
jgi:ribosomal protein S12 methylthiotransferase accessory factor YcaO